MSENTSRQRIGLFGGTFDPIHIGHLLIAEAAREQLGLDQVRFIPAAHAPHKLEQPATAGKQRLEMIRLAIGGHPHFASDDRELRRGGTSYTVDTLAEIKREIPEAELVFLLGSDSLDELHTWREPRRICELAFLGVIARGGHPPPDLMKLREFLPESQHADLTSHLVTMPQMEISSREIRKRIAQGRSVRYQLHPAVEAYIDARQLYRTPA
jgi:nicotinate-nucleotide adenylyltransferase